MAPPPVTPSPHRFITSTPNNERPKPPSTLRTVQSAFPPPSSTQFAKTPKFSSPSQALSVKSKHEPEDVPDSPTSPSSPLVLSRLRKPPLQNTTTKTGEEIDDSPSSPQLPSPLNAQDESFHLPAYSSKTPRTFRETPTDLIEDICPSPSQESLTTRSTRPLKRHRRHHSLSPSPLQSVEHNLQARAHSVSSSPPSSPSPPASASLSPQLPSTPHPRFRLYPHAPTTTQPVLNPHPLRPTFLPTPVQPPPHPFPETFSPHRRGAKYIPNGLASTVRDWIVEASSARSSHASTIITSTIRPRQTQTATREWDQRIEIKEIKQGMGMILIEGIRGERWILLSEIGGKKMENIDDDVDVERGRRARGIGIRKPFWDIMVGTTEAEAETEEQQGKETEKWEVGVNWAFLN